jgi:hypothetical protein
LEVISWETTMEYMLSPDQAAVLMNTATAKGRFSRRITEQAFAFGAGKARPRGPVRP